VADTRAVFDDSQILQVFEESPMPVPQPEFSGIIWHCFPDQTVCQVEPAGV
jgi:hypothetical protein